MPQRSSTRTTQDAIASLTAIAVTLPGMAHAQEAPLMRPETWLKYTHHHESGDRYNINIYNGLLKMPVTDRFGLTVNFNREVMAGASVALTGPEFLKPPVGQGPATTSFKTAELKSKATIVDERNEAKLKGTYHWDNIDASLGAIYSVENDYTSRTGLADATFYFNKKNTALTLGASFSDDRITPEEKDRRLLPTRLESNMGRKRTQTYYLGIKQDLSKKSYLQQNFEYSCDKGFLGDSYKGIVIHGNASSLPGAIFYNAGGVFGYFGGAVVPAGLTLGYDYRPNFRDSYRFVTRYVHYVESLGSSVHADYRFAYNSWKIKSHTVSLSYFQPFGDGDTWQISPSVRYYTQNEAKFYGLAFTAAPNSPWLARDLPASGAASSDYRLASFGSLGGEIRLTKNFTPDIQGNMLLGYTYRDSSLGFSSRDPIANPSNRFDTRYVSVGVRVVF